MISKKKEMPFHRARSKKRLLQRGRAFHRNIHTSIEKKNPERSTATVAFRPSSTQAAGVVSSRTNLTATSVVSAAATTTTTRDAAGQRSKVATAVLCQGHPANSGIAAASWSCCRRSGVLRKRVEKSVPGAVKGEILQ